MSNRAMALTKRQVKALCLGAAEAGMIPEIQINGVYVRLVPQSHIEKQVPILDTEPDELEQFKAKHGYK